MTVRQRIRYRDGTELLISYSCCGADAVISREKVLTTTTVDAMRRVNSSTALGVTVTNVLDMMGRALVSRRIAGGQTNVLSAVKYDSLGEVVYETNALEGRVT